MIRDFNCEWLEKRIYIPATVFQSQVLVLTEGTPNTFTQFAPAGLPFFQELSTLTLAGVQIAAAANAVSHTMMIPYDLDRTKQVRFRVWFSSTSTDADVITWLLTYAAHSAGDALVDPQAGASGVALSTAIPAITRSTTANAIEVTDFGVLNRNTLTDAREWISLCVEADSIGAASANEISFMGLEMRYTPRRTAGPRRNILGGRRLKTGFPLGVQLHTAQEGL